MFKSTMILVLLIEWCFPFCDYSPAIKDASWEKREIAVLRFPVACTSVNVSLILVNRTETDTAMPIFQEMVLTIVRSFYPL